MNLKQITPERLKSFQAFWKLYDKKIGKMIALIAWTKIDDEDIDSIMNVVEKYVQATPDKRYRPHASTFLNQRRWEDDIDDLREANKKQITNNDAREDVFQKAMNEKIQNFKNDINDENERNEKIRIENRSDYEQRRIESGFRNRSSDHDRS